MSDTINELAQAGRSANALSAIANPGQLNVLGAYAGAAGTASKIYELQGMQAQKAWGQALQAATDENGVTDYAKASAIAAQNPLAAMGMMSGLKGATDLTGAVQAQGINRNAMVNSAISAALKLPDDQLHQGVLDGVNGLVSNGVMTRAAANQALLRLSPDPATMRTQLEQLRIAQLPPEQRQQAIYGIPGSQTGPGGETVGTRQSVQSGVVTPAQPSGSGAPLGLTPQQLDAPYTVTDPKTGQPRTTTLRQFFIDNGFNFPASGGAGGGPGGLPSSLRNPANKTPPAANPPPTTTTTPAPNASPPNAAPTPGPQPVPTGPAPGMAEKWKASAEQYTADTAAAGQYQQRIFPLAQGRALLESGDVTTGAGAEAVQNLKNLLGTVAAQMGWNPNEINNAKFQELNKYLTQYTNNLPMAGASDARLASALTGNPSAHISTMANKDVIKALIGLERMKQTAITEFKAQGGSPQDYADYLTNWQNTHDPRAFIFDMMDDGARKKMVAGMKTDEERQRFNDTLDLVQRHPGIMGQAAMPGR